MRCVDCLPLIEEYFDGEVEERLAAEMGAHLSSCADCTAALDALSIEQETYARYNRELEVSPTLWARVSAEIAREPLHEPQTEGRPFLSRTLAGLAAVFSTLLSNLAARPALASSFALILVGVTAGSLWFAHVQRATSASVAVNNPPAPAPRATTPPSINDDVERSKPGASETPFGVVNPKRFEGDVEAAAAPSTRETKPHVPKPGPSPEDLNSLLAPQSATAQDAGIVRIKYDAHAEVSPEIVNVAATDRDVVTTDAQLLDPEQKEVARHVEQAQMLLRSIKNARAEGGDTVNVAYEKKLSRKLLSDNATLQLDAETRGDRDTKQVLDRIEPYLLDIANMHDNASREEVRSLRERIDRKEIIAALQVY